LGEQFADGTSKDYLQSLREFSQCELDTFVGSECKKGKALVNLDGDVCAFADAKTCEKTC
jgi:hypothetical protein